MQGLCSRAPERFSQFPRALWFERVAHALLQVVVGGAVAVRARLPGACKEVLYAELVKQGLRCVFSQDARALWFERVVTRCRAVRYATWV